MNYGELAVFVYVSPTYSEPLAEIAALAALLENGNRAFLILAPRNAPPMDSAGTGEEVLLCTRSAEGLVSHAVTWVHERARTHATTPQDVAGLYGPTAGRMFVELGTMSMHPLRRIDQLSQDEQDTFGERAGVREMPEQGKAPPDAAICFGDA